MRKYLKYILMGLFALISLVSIPISCTITRANYKLEVERIDNLSKDFILAMDLSSLESLERAGVEYHDFKGHKRNPFYVLKSVGITHIRVRLWNDPFDSNGNSYGGGACDINNLISLSKRAKANKLKLILDFHYSDFWADPANQRLPKTWKGISLAEKAHRLYHYTSSTLAKLKSKGIIPDIVELGNEIDNGLLEETDIINISRLLKEGIRAVNNSNASIRTAVHYASTKDESKTRFFAKELKKNGVDYDIFSLSYYPNWHGSMANLEYVLKKVKEENKCQVMIMEAAYPYTLRDSDYTKNQIESKLPELEYEVSYQGQANFIRDLVDAVNKVGGIGIAYWEGLWIKAPGDDYLAMRDTWEQYGCGIATSKAAEYYGVANVSPQGSACDNQALFDWDGHPLPSLRVFKLLRRGN